MNKEELKLEAEDKLDEWTDPDMGCEGYCYSEVADFMFRFSEPREKRITELENEVNEWKHKYVTQIKEYVKLKDQIADVIECFCCASSGDDLEMAESAREVMEVLDIPCYRHGKVKSKYTKAKELIKNIVKVTWGEGWNYSLDWKVKAEEFLREE